MAALRILAGALLLVVGLAPAQTLEELGGRALGAAQEGRFADAVLLYERMLKLAPGSREVRYDLALALNRLGRNRESLTVLGKPTNSEELTLAGINHRTLGDLAAAERDLRAAFAMAPDASIAADFGMVLLDREKYDEAERVFRGYPDEVQPVLGLGLAAFARGRNAEAEKLFAAAVAREPEAADLRVSLGDVYFATDRFAEADMAYREAIRLEPRSAEYRLKAGRNALRLDKQAEAQEHFRQAVILDPLQAEAHLELGRLSGERRHLEAAVAADPTRGAAHYQLALLYRRLGLTELSSASMRRFEQIRKQGEQAYRIDMTPPAVVVEGPADEKRWGRYQFPTAYRMADGRVIAFVDAEARQTFVSSDDGLSWREDREAEKSPFGLRLPGGEWLRIDGHISFQRFVKGAWRAESTVVDDAGKSPRIWWGDMEVMPDGALVAVTYPGIDAKGPPSAWRSADRGRTWRLLARIPYVPEEKADSKAAQRDGFTEPAFTRLRDGSLLAVLRTTDGNGVGPMYQTRSRDGGRTWNKPVVIAPNGVQPRLLRLDNGVLVLVSGRPGVQMRFSRSGLGDDWSEAVDIVPATSEKLDHDSCGYTSLVALGGDSFLLAYSWFQKPDAAGEPRKTVLSRRVRIAVRPTGKGAR